MEQRRLRLGDILDDYCPRERRVTNHAVVAMIEEDVKQTRCTTCDAEHAYKGARVPKRRKKETPSGLFKEVLAGMPEIEDVPALAAAPVPAVVAAPLPAAPVIAALAAEPSAAPLPTVNVVPSHPSTTEDRLRPMHSDDHDDIPAPTSAPQSHAEFSDVTSRSDDQPPTVDGPVHRQLIRATLPRPEGAVKEARPVTDFTVRHAPPRGNGHGSFRGGGGDRDRMRMRGGGNGSGHGNGHGNGNGHSNANGNRFQGNRPPGSSRQPMGRTGAPSGFRSSGPGQGSKRGRGGSRG